METWGTKKMKWRRDIGINNKCHEERKKTIWV